MNHSILSRAPKVPSIFISPRFFLSFFLLLNVNISILEARDMSKKISKGESINLDFSEAQVNELVRNFKTEIDKNDGRLKFQVNGLEVEIVEFNKNLNGGVLNLKIPGEKFKSKDCEITLMLNVNNGEEVIRQGLLNCNFKF